MITVKELIKQLETIDPNKKVQIWIGRYKWDYDIKLMNETKNELLLNTKSSIIKGGLN